ncbi:MAG: ATP-binding protein [Candidatus Aminicenantes bacterium]|jgi:signal transduction histidine kinase
MALFFHFSVNTTILPDLKRQKRVTIENQKAKLQVAISEEERDLTAICSSLAKWKGLINYCKTPSTKFETEFLEAFPFLNYRTNVILIQDCGGQVLYNRNWNNHEKLIALGDLEIKGSLDEITGQINRTLASFTGIINSAYGPILLAACPICNHPPSPSTSGLLILGRFMDQEFLKRISIRFTDTLQLVPFNENQRFQSYLKRMQGTDFVYRGDEEKSELLYLVKDLDQTPSFILKIASASKLPGIMRKHTLHYVIFTVLSIIFLGFLVYFLIEKYITKRISKISLDMKNVQGLKDISMRIRPDKKGDEISSLIANINETLDKIEREKKGREEIEKLLITRERLVSVGRLAGSIAHEINSPILAISNCIQVFKKSCLKKGDKDYDRKEKAITVSKKETQRIREIISRLLDFQPSDVEELTRVNLHEVIGKSREVVKWSTKLSSIKIIIEKQQDFFIMGSPGRLKQVFINLILNAVEATGNDNKNKPVLRIEILPSKDKDFCEVHFKDNGPGILPQIKNRLFEPFTSTKKGKSVGLGLYVSYKIIKNHQGEILYDDSYKQGTHFIIKLPVKERHI